MTALRNFVAEKLEATNTNPFEAARRGGLERSFVNDILIEKKHSVSARNIPKLAAALEASQDEILAVIASSIKELQGRQVEPNAVFEPKTKVLAPVPAELPRDIQELGVTEGGDGADQSSFELNGEVADLVRRPPGLMHRKDVFALRVMNVSMYPKFEDRERIFVERRKPAIGDYVVVELHPNDDNSPSRSYIKKLIAADSAKITVEQFNPHGILEFGRREIKQLLRVIPPIEWLGI